MEDVSDENGACLLAGRKKGRRGGGGSTLLTKDTKVLATSSPGFDETLDRAGAARDQKKGLVVEHWGRMRFCDGCDSE